MNSIEFIGLCEISFDDETSWKMVVLQHSIQFSFIIVTCIVLSTVQGVSNKLREIVDEYCNREAVEQVVEKHLEEVMESIPLHIIIDLKVDDITLNIILMKYMQTRSSYLWNSDELDPKNVESCVPIRRIVGIYSDISHVRPSDQREFFHKLWEPRAKFVMWVSGIVVRPVIQTLLENFWSLDCLNVVIVKDFNCTQINRFSYNPFMIGAYKRGKLLKLSSMDKFFFRKTTNLYGYKIPISIYNAVPNVILMNHTTLEGARGGEVEALRYLSSWMNFTIVLKSSPLPLSSYIQYLPNGTYHEGRIGPVGDIIKGRSDVIGNPQLFALASDHELNFLYPLKSVELQIAVPLDSESSSIAKMFQYVDPLSEILILVAVVIFSLYVSIVHKRNILITYFRLLFQANIHPISDRVSERIFMFSWLIFATIVAMAHQTHIMKSLTDRTISQSIKTIKDLRESDLKIVLDSTHFKNMKSGAARAVVDVSRIEINPDFSECMLRLEKGERVACVGTEPVVTSGIDVMTKRLIANSGKTFKQPYIIKTSRSLLSTLIVRNGFPYLQRFNEGSFRMYSFGLVQKWRRHEHVGRFRETKEFEGPLHLSQFQGVFGLFAIWIILANMALIGEIIFYYIKIRA